MNKERILHLASVIEVQPHTDVADLSGFNMLSFFHPCGTPSCIAGWAIALFPTEDKAAPDHNIYMRSLAKGCEALSISPEQGEELFAPEHLPWNSVTPAQAAFTLRKLAETGEVDWSHCDE